MKNAIMDIGTILNKPPVMNSLRSCTLYASSPIASKDTIVHFLSVDCRTSQEKKHRDNRGGRGVHGELPRLFWGLIRDRRARANMMRGPEDPQPYEAFPDATSPGVGYRYREIEREHDHNIC